MGGAWENIDQNNWSCSEPSSESLLPGGESPSRCTGFIKERDCLTTDIGTAAQITDPPANFVRPGGRAAAAAAIAAAVSAKANKQSRSAIVACCYVVSPCSPPAFPSTRAWGSIRCPLACQLAYDVTFFFVSAQLVVVVGFCAFFFFFMI